MSKTLFNLVKSLDTGIPAEGKFPESKGARVRPGPFQH